MDIVSRLPPRVPEDLIIEIFLRSPVKSLLRFMSVCREWHKIIKNPSFERDHFHRGGEFTSHLAYWYGGPCNHNLDFENERDIEIHEELGSMFGDEIALQRYEVPGLNDILSMQGPCYGIICVAHTNNTLVLWNPTTKRSQSLPTCPLVTWNTRIGFGLDPVTDDLKTVLFDARLNKRQYAIYNSRNGAWNLLKSNTILHTDSFAFTGYAGYPVLNGVCYWVIRDIRAHKNSLLAFDMSSDLFQDIELPEILQHGWETTRTLDIIEDNLALVTYDCLYYEEYGSNNIEIWLMKTHGCWTKQSAVKLDFHGIVPVRCWKMNPILIRTCENEMIIDLDSGNTSVLGRRNGSRKLFIFPCQYKESLISV